MKNTVRTTIFSTAALLIFATPAFAATEIECATMWKQADLNADNALSALESERFAAMMRIAEKTMPADGIINEAMFKENCLDAVFDTAEMDVEGAPFEGANSFTETQAKDRLLAAGMTTPSALIKDDKGIWRGNATENGTVVSVSVDFKGNVGSE